MNLPYERSFKMKYKIGDKVCYKHKKDSDNVEVGEVGAIRGFSPSGNYAVDFETDDPCKHDCGGRCNNFHGWWCDENTLEPVVPTLAEIKKKKLTCVIHTKTKAEAQMLIEYMPQKDWKKNPLDYWDLYAEETGYYIVDGQLFQFSPVSLYKHEYPHYGEIYEFSDLFAIDGIATLKSRDESISFESPYLDLSSLILPTNSREFEEKINKELTEHFNAFPNDGISAKNGGKNSMKFTFYVTEGTRVDKSCNGTIPTMTTTVTNGLDEVSVTCDKVDFNERQGVLEGIAQLYCKGRFDKEYEAAVKINKRSDKVNRTCIYCGKIFDTAEERAEHEKWHVERKKARRERYLLRKRAKEIAFEEQAQKMAKEMMGEQK
jgi:hypothetical protein